MAEVEEGEITENEISEEEENNEEPIASEDLKKVSEENEILIEDLIGQKADEQELPKEENEEEEIEESEMEGEGMGEEGIEAEEIKAEGIEAEGIEAEEIKAQGIEAEEIKEEGIKPEVMEAEGIKEDGKEEKGMEKKGIEEEEIKKTEMKNQEATRLQSNTQKEEIEKMEKKIKEEHLSQYNLQMDEILAKPPESIALRGRIDDKTMKKLEEVEKEVKEAGNAIYTLKHRVDELLTKEALALTEEELKEMEEIAEELPRQVDIFEEKTKEIQDIIANTNILETMPVRLPQAKHEEDVLPRVLLCGELEDYVPKIVVCNQKTKGSSHAARECMPGCPGSSTPPTSAPSPKQICGNYDEQKAISAENADVEKIRSKLEEDISNKDKILEGLQLNLVTLQNEIKMVSTENTVLNERIRKLQQSQANQKQQLSEPKKMCPSMMAAKLQQYSEYTRRLEKQLSEMEKDFSNVHRDICTAQKERERLEQTRNTMAKPFCRKK